MSADRPNRAMISAAPRLKVVCSAITGSSSSQYQVTGSPVPSTIAKSTSMDSSICCNSTTTYASGRQARGKYMARISVIFARMTREADDNRPLGEGKYENPGDQIGGVISDALG